MARTVCAYGKAVPHARQTATPITSDFRIIEAPYRGFVTLRTSKSELRSEGAVLLAPCNGRNAHDSTSAPAATEAAETSIRSAAVSRSAEGLRCSRCIRTLAAVRSDAGGTTPAGATAS